MDFPREHRATIQSANPIDRLDGEIRRRIDVVSIVPNEGAILPEQSDEWATLGAPAPRDGTGPLQTRHAPPSSRPRTAANAVRPRSAAPRSARHRRAERAVSAGCRRVRSRGDPAARCAPGSPRRAWRPHGPQSGGRG
ncbi:transposase [Roseomonas sp. ROY-5-3]|uniref:Transposase n=1 Tax=Falsiroseomonas oleicola TaxID=2801474 RepID=A0ABS6H7I9_9PROT|nr:transposase [Roseomonas oleicola]